MILVRLERYLEDHGIPYAIFPHPPAVSAQRTAQAEHVSGWQVVKSVAVELGSGEELICALPAPAVLDLDAVCDATGSKDAVLVEKPRLDELFRGCEEGSIPPFGGLWNLPVLFDRSLEAVDRIFVNGGDHRTLIEIPTADYLQLEQPRIVRIARMPGAPWSHAIPADAEWHSRR